MRFLIAILFFAGTAFAQNREAPTAPAPEKPEMPHEKIVDSPGALKSPKVFFVSPKDGETVKGEFTVKMGVNGMKVKPATTQDVGTGHHHLIIDGGALAKGLIVPKDDKNLHFGKGETTTKVKLPPGEHTLTLQFADGSHASYGPEMSQTIKVKVK